MNSEWRSTAKMINEKLIKENIPIEFNIYEKRTDRYLKAALKNNVFLAFARAKDDLWIEIEIKPIQGSQDNETYKLFVAHRNEIQEKFGNKLFWDEETRKLDRKDKDRNTCRIMFFLRNYNGSVIRIKEESTETMYKLIKAMGL